MVSWCNVGVAACIEGDCDNGYGTYTWADGRKYVGEWKNDKKHGQGTLTWAASGSKYVGEFKDSARHGQGTYTWADGRKYVGEFKDNKRNGQGTFTSPDGSKYVGEFKDGKGHGQGTFTSADGSVDEGKWKKGKLVKRKKLSKEEKAAVKAEADAEKEKIQLSSMIDSAKNTCKDLGFEEGTDKFTDCSLKLYSQSVELAAKNKQQVVQSGMSSGVVTIYDPVRDRQRMIDQGMKMITGRCTLGYDC